MVAVGTTTVRVLETIARGGPLSGRTELYVTPGFEFRRVDALLTNFHLPRSTLLALVMAFAGVEETRALYRLAVAERYRFYSFGDAMLLLVSFRLVATDGAARAGVLTTAHGDVPTPAFMPVGTKATVKGIDPEGCAGLGASILLANAYHLHFRPGDETIEALGGLHRFMGWERPILTDSGGFQVFSLRTPSSRLDDDGVSFRSVYDGRTERFTPELAAEIQRRLGSDVAMCARHLPAGGRDPGRARDAPSSGRPRGLDGSSRPRERRDSSSSGSRRAVSTATCGGGRSRRSRRSASTATRSAG